MSNVGNFGDMLSDELNLNVNSMFESNDDSKGGGSEDEETTAIENNKTNDADDHLDIEAFFDSNIANNGDTEGNSRDDSPDSENNSEIQSSSNSAPSNNFTAILAKDLMDQGIISSISDEDFNLLIKEKGEAGALRALIEGEVSNASAAMKSDYDESYQEYLSMIEGGVDKNIAGDLVSNKNVFDAITDDQIDDEDNESLRRDLMTENYKITTNFSDAKIKKLVDRSFELGEDIEEAKDALTNIKAAIDSKIKDEKIAAKSRDEDYKKQLEDNKNNLRQSIDSIKEIIPGQKINKQTKDKMFDLITKPVQDKNGNTTNALWAKRAEDPIEFDQKLAYLLQTGFFEKGKSWDKVNAVHTTTEASKLDEFLANNSSSRSGKISIRSNSKDTKDLIKSTASILGR